MENPLARGLHPEPSRSGHEPLGGDQRTFSAQFIPGDLWPNLFSDSVSAQIRRRPAARHRSGANLDDIPASYESRRSSWLIAAGLAALIAANAAAAAVLSEPTPRPGAPLQFLPEALAPAPARNSICAGRRRAASAPSARPAHWNGCDALAATASGPLPCPMTAQQERARPLAVLGTVIGPASPRGERAWDEPARWGPFEGCETAAGRCQTMPEQLSGGHHVSSVQQQHSVVCYKQETGEKPLPAAKLSRHKSRLKCWNIAGNWHLTNYKYQHMDY